MTLPAPAPKLLALEQAPHPRIRVQIAEDGLSAFITLSPGEACEGEALLQALQSAHVVFGLDQAAMRRLAAGLTDPAFEIAAELVATGTPAQAGQEGLFNPLFVPGIQAGRFADDGTVDFHDRDFLKPVAAGEVIAWVTPAVPGVPGQRVDGQELATAAVRDFSLSLGVNVELAADGAIRARQPGVVLYKSGQSLDVVQHYQHPGDVDLRSGDLDMEGTLGIKGSVRQSFSVVCTGDVEIAGGVEGASIRAGGNVVVKLGVTGSADASVEAEGGMALHHAENARLSCRRLLKVEEATGCELRAERIEVTKRLRGGNATAEHSIVVGEAGNSHSATETILVAGEPLPSPLGDAQRKLVTAKTQRMAQRRSLAPRASGLGERQKGGKLGREQVSLGRSELEHKIDRLKRKEQLLQTAFVQVQGALYPGVRIQLGEASVSFAEVTHRARFTFDSETRTIRSERASP